MGRYVDPVSVLGPDIAKRVKPLGDGRRYVRPGEWALIAAWLVDFMVFVVGLVGGTVALVLADPGDAVVVLGVLVLLVAVPLVYGLFYRNGRALGALVTSTQLVRFKDGGRLGFWAPWAMLVRLLLLPLWIIPWLVSGGGGPPGSVYRVSIDKAPTRILWAAESAAERL